MLQSGRSPKTKEDKAGFLDTDIEEQVFSGSYPCQAQF